MIVKPEQDAYGRELYDCMTGESVSEIVERDDGYIQAGSADQYFAEYPHWPQHQRMAVRYARGKALDIGCGGGPRCSISSGEGLGRSWHRYLAACHTGVQGQRGQERSRIVAQRFRGKGGQFDTILMMGHNFGLFGNHDDAQRLLRRFHKCTNPGARLIVESLDPYDTTSPEHLEYHRRNHRRGRMAGQIRLRVRHKGLATPWFDYLFVSRSEMEGLLHGTGWELRRCFDSGGRSYCAVIQRMSV